MSRKKLRRDRDAGLHFHWHLSEGSLSRLVIAILCATAFWALLLAYVQIRVPEPSALPQRASDLEVIDLNAAGNQRLASYIERESPFASRWVVQDDSALKKQISKALASNTREPYRVTLQEIKPTYSVKPLSGLPGLKPGTLPAPEPIEIPPITRAPAEWWLSVNLSEQSDQWDGLTFRWEGEEQDLSVGELWTFQIGIDWRGRLVSKLPLKGRKETPSKAILDSLRTTTFPKVKEGTPIRWWMLEAHAVDQSNSSKPNPSIK